MIACKERIDDILREKQGVSYLFVVEVYYTLVLAYLVIGNTFMSEE